MCGILSQINPFFPQTVHLVSKAISTASSNKILSSISFEQLHIGDLSTK